MNVLQEPTWKNGWNLTYATRFCEEKILNGITGQQCSKLDNLNQRKTVLECVADIKVGLLNGLKGIIPSLKNEIKPGMKE